MSPEVPEGSIVITPKEFYDGVKNDVHDIQTAVSGIDKKLDPLPRSINDLNARVSRLEQKVWWMAGAAASAAALAGAILSHVLH